MWSYFANPERFDRLAAAMLPWTWGLAIALFAVGLPWALVFSPADYQQSETVRIMYVHVPAAWLAMAAYAGLGVPASSISSGAITWPISPPARWRRRARSSPFCAWRPARCGAGPCGAPGGFGMRA
jgi:hypothetical protein